MVDPNGNQTDPFGNQLVRITGLAPFTTASFSSTGNAFEFTLATVPEPSTWAMMVIGFAGLGYAAFRRNSKGRALAVSSLQSRNLCKGSPRGGPLSLRCGQ
jgi:hypothetical protein